MTKHADTFLSRLVLTTNIKKDAYQPHNVLHITPFITQHFIPHRRSRLG